MESISISITPHTYSFFFPFLIRTLKFSSLSKFQLYNSVEVGTIYLLSSLYSWGYLKHREVNTEPLSPRAVNWGSTRSLFDVTRLSRDWKIIQQVPPTLCKWACLSQRAVKYSPLLPVTRLSGNCDPPTYLTRDPQQWINTPKLCVPA